MVCFIEQQKQLFFIIAKLTIRVWCSYNELTNRLHILLGVLQYSTDAR